jgi:thiosulfate reductase cytochrome b subunit
MEIQPIGKILIALGLLLVIAGVLMVFAPKLPYIGRLPGDIYIKRGNFTLYFPIASSILISIILTIILSFVLSKK